MNWPRVTAIFQKIMSEVVEYFPYKWLAFLDLDLCPAKTK